jgi:hypothetical protein
LLGPIFLGQARSVSLGKHCHIPESIFYKDTALCINERLVKLHLRDPLPLEFPLKGTLVFDIDALC